MDDDLLIFTLSMVDLLLLWFFGFCCVGFFRRVVRNLRSLRKCFLGGFSIFGRWVGIEGSFIKKFVGKIIIKYFWS